MTVTQQLTATQYEALARDGFHIARGLLRETEATALRDVFMQATCCSSTAA